LTYIIGKIIIVYRSVFYDRSRKKQLGFVDCLVFNVEKARRDIVEFVRNEVKNFWKCGVLVGLSGGLDSSTVAYLCVEALGKDKVMGLILPERDSNPKNIDDA
jgi:NAD+ synthase